MDDDEFEGATGFTRQEYQRLVDTGQAWRFEGSFGRQTMDLLRAGELEFPDQPTTDYWGNPIPTRQDFASGRVSWR